MEPLMHVVLLMAHVQSRMLTVTRKSANVDRNTLTSMENAVSKQDKILKKTPKNFSPFKIVMLILAQYSTTLF